MLFCVKYTNCDKNQKTDYFVGKYDDMNNIKHYFRKKDTKDCRI